MDRKELIQLYLDAEATPEQEKELARSFAATPPTDRQEKAVYRLLQAVEPLPLPERPEAGEEYDRMVLRSVRRPFFWGVTGVAAAAMAAVLLFIGQPKEPQEEYSSLLEQIAFLSNFDPSEAESLEFKPVGDGYVMTAHFPDGQTASFILTPLDGGESFNLIALKQ